jgi:hypothetical protein
VRRRLDREWEMDRWPVPWRSLLLVAVLGALMLVLLGLLVLTVVSLRTSDPEHVVGPSWFSWFDANCENAAFSCAVVAGALVAPIPIVVGVLGLLAWRLWRIRRRFQHHAREQAPALVQTAASGDEIVGRDALCAVLKRNVEDSHKRLPHVLVGGVGVGKTAVLVRMTRLLAKKGAVPVPVRLREAQDPADLDFGDLARKRFLRLVDRRVYSEAEGDKIWRKLREQDRIVVLADGLEEALISQEHRARRDTTIRAAFAHAKSIELPLIVTSRPHPTLRYLDAALLRMEPLSEGAAFGFIRRGRSATDPKVKLIVENAEVVEAPLYMQLAQALDEHKLLTNLDARCATRLALRIHLLDTWHDALVAGKLSSEIPHPPAERQQALSDLGSIAVSGLLDDSLEVKFTALELLDAMGLSCVDGRYSAGVGGRLEVVEAHADSVRFRHSIVQAYLGSRRLDAVPLGVVAEAIKRIEGPGRELLMALVMACWREESASRRKAIRDLLCEQATRNDAKGIDLLAAAAEIDGMIPDRDRDWIADAIAKSWPGSVEETVAEAKLAAIGRLGDLAHSRGRPTGREHLRRRAGGMANGASTDAAAPIDSDALRALRHVALKRGESYAARLAAAQQIGSAGAAAVRAFGDEFEAALERAERLFPANGHHLEEDERLEFTLHAWVLPTLIGSEKLEAADQQKLREVIGPWLALVRRGVHPSIEEAWARGLKLEANRRPRHANVAMRNFLAEEAERLLEGSDYWFTRVTLFHAFTLWGLADDEDDASSANGAVHERRRVRRQARDRARRIVNSWNTDRSHPFVHETASLCQEALRTRRPGRYIWIDETGIVSKLGASSSRPEDVSNSRLWISPAAGWIALHPRALRLVGELILALNLAEGADGTRREDRLERMGRATALPPCLTQRNGRAALQIRGGQYSGPRPGSTCVPGCSIHLCPYPPPGQAPLRGELSEAFCRRQVDAVDHVLWSRLWRRDRVPPGQRKKFWEQMEERARL